MMMNESCFAFDRNTEPDINVLAHESSHATLDRHIIPILADRCLLLLFNSACLAEKLQMPILMSFVSPGGVDSTFFHT